MSAAKARISIVVPTLNEAAGIRDALAALQSYRGRGHEVIVADGGSSDRTLELARGLADVTLVAPRGRAAQMNAGARAASGSALLFLHADTLLPARADELIAAALETRPWGRFDVRIGDPLPLLRLVGWMMNLRSRLGGIATGDQAIFVRREQFEDLGGYAAIPLMEDVELSVRLRRVAPPACLRERVVTSPRRWLARGVLRTILLMWRLRLAYALGADPASLAKRYR